ncbi:unnamed protein product [Prunus armeniaca]
MDFSRKHRFCIKDFVHKAEQTGLEGVRGQSWSPLLVSWGSGSRKLKVAVGVGWICYDAHNTFLTLYEEL